MFYTEDRDVTRKHLLGAATRLMKAGKVEGAAKAAKQCLDTAEWLDTIETEPKPEAQPKTKKS